MDEANPLSAGLVVSAVKLTPIDPNRAVAVATVTGGLTLTFACQICKDGAVVPVAKPKKEEPKKEEPKKGKEKGKGDGEDDEPALAPLPIAPPPVPLGPRTPVIGLPRPLLPPSVEPVTPLYPPSEPKP